MHGSHRTLSPHITIARYNHTVRCVPIRKTSEGVHLLNAHTGKGQQFDWVFVVGLEEGHLPPKRSSTGAALAEERRVLLVMLSRARHGLVVTRVLTAEGPYGRYRAKPCRWWSGIQAGASSAEEIEAHLDIGAIVVP